MPRATPGPLPDTTRATLLARARAERVWDLVVVGGGATGLGLALDAAARGFSVLLFEAGDFAQGSSSRATKLVHGGVRYLAQGRVSLVREALRERSTLLANAPHLAQPLAFVMPAYRWWERGFYGLGLKLYDVLAGARGLGPTEILSSTRTRALLPTVGTRGLGGGVKYWDAQFDDARLAVALARTAVARGAVVLNHCPVTALLREAGQVRGVVACESESGTTLRIAARCVVNATGVWVDGLRRMDRDADAPEKPALVAPSQGVHLVVDRAFLPGEHALLVPRTTDGRVLFAVPWLGKTILGTTDTPCEAVTDVPSCCALRNSPLGRPGGLAREPLARADEVDFILREAGRYLEPAPTRADVRSVWVGLRPLVRPDRDEDGSSTGQLSREHSVLVSRSGLVTVTGGKWTTYRAMAEDVLEHCFARQLLPRRAGGATLHLPLVGAPTEAASAARTPLTHGPGEHLYGSEAALLRTLPGAACWLWRDAAAEPGGLSEAMVRFAVRHEMARSVEDVLARRSRLLFLDAAQAARQAGAVAAILAEELGAAFDARASQQAFEALAAQYRHVPQ